MTRLHKSIHVGAFPPSSYLRRRASTDAVFTFDPGSKRLATGTGPVTLLDVETGETLLVWGDQSLGHASDIQSTPNGKMVLVALDKEPGHMYVGDASNGVELLRLKGHTGIVWKAHFSTCGEYVASASADKTVRLWRMRDGCCVATFSEHRSGVSHLTFSPNGRTLSSGDKDGTVIIRCMDGTINIPVDDRDPSA